MRRLLIVLGVLIVACGAAPVSSAPTPESLPPIPATIGSQLGPVSIVLQDSLMNEDGRVLLGGFMPANRTIYLSSKIKDRLVLWQIIYHEDCHVVLWDTGLRNFFNGPGGEKMADALCDAFATARVAELVHGRR